MKPVNIRYVGGPLNGELAVPRGNKQPAYRREDGSTMPAGQGDHARMARYVLVWSGDREQVYQHYAEGDAPGKHLDS